jgi:hypothetical protein
MARGTAEYAGLDGVSVTPVELRTRLPALLRGGARRYGFDDDRWTIRRIEHVMWQAWRTRYSETYTYKLLVRAFGKLWSKGLKHALAYAVKTRAASSGGGLK